MTNLNEQTIIRPGQYHSYTFLLFILSTFATNTANAIRGEFISSIIGGTETPPVDSFSWFVTTYPYLGCGATLVAPEMVLTAAHCMTVFGYALEGQDYKFPLQIGAFCQEVDNCSENFELIYVEEMFVHPEFDMVTGLPEHDLALLKLSRAAETEPVKMDMYGVSFDYESGECRW